jgi:hypothetical protein
MYTQEQKRLVELFGELPEDYQKLMLGQIEAMVNPNEVIQEQLRRETEEALSDPVYRAELVLGSYLPTEHGEKMMGDPKSRKAVLSNVKRDLERLEGKHLFALMLLVDELTRKVEAPTPEA